MYVQGEYGIGKSSIAGVVQGIAEMRYGLHGIYAPLGSATSLNDLGAVVLESTIRSGALNQNRADEIRNWLAKYIGEPSFFGVTIHAEALKRDGPTVASGMLPFLTQVLERLQDTGVKGIFLVLDEINGIASNRQFAHFLKSLVDTNAMAPKPLPLLLMLCGVEERRREIVRNHQPVERIFDVIDIETMSEDEMREFFEKAFNSVDIQVEQAAMKAMTYYSAGFPKIMHLIGDSAFWMDQDGIIDEGEAYQAVIQAASEVGKKYVDHQVYRALRSKDYHSILRKIAKTGPEMSFYKSDIEKGLGEGEKRNSTTSSRE